MEVCFELDDCVARLKNKPTLAEIESIVKSVNQILIKNLVAQLSLITTLLNYTIPDTYDKVNIETKHQLVQLFQSTVGLGNLISRISLLKSSVTPHLNEFGLLSTLVEFLVSLFQPGLVLKLVKNALHLEVKEIDKLLHKGKCFSLINEICIKCQINMNNTIFNNSITYVGYLNMEMLRLYKNKTDVTVINIFINSLASLNQESLNQLFDIMFNEEHWNYFIESFERMKRFERKNILTKFLTSYVTKRYFKAKNPSIHKVAALSVLSKPVFKADLIDEILLEKVIATSDYFLNSLVSLMLSELPEKNYHSLVIRSLQYWSNPHLMKSESIIRQEYRTHLVINLFSHCSPDFLRSLLAESNFLDAISNRLSSQSSKIKTLGVILADKLCEFSGIDQIFNLDNIEGYDILVDSKSYFKKSDVALSDIQYSWDLLDEPEVIRPEDNDVMTSHINAMNDITTQFEFALKSNKADSDNDSVIDSDDEDDPTIGPKPQVARPIYIKDLLDYITTDSKDAQAFEKRKLALTYGPTLIRQKAGFGNDLQFYSDDLLTNLAGLTNTFDDADFESQRLANLIAVVSSNPDSGIRVCQLLAIGDYSLQQRMCLLSTLSLSARELKGFEDDIVTLTFKKSSFPSKMLPGNLHNKYLALENGYSNNEKIIDYGLGDIQHTIQDELMQEASEEANDQLAGGKVLRISRNLTKKREKSASLITKPTSPEFNAVVGSKLYFPLVSVWHESGGQINIGEFSPILIAHYIKTLALILHAACATTHEINTMIKEFVLIIIPVVKRVSIDELQVIESVTTGMLLVCDICESDYLIENYANELRLIQEWLSVIWDSIIDDKVKSLCAGLLLRLTQYGDSYERLLLDRMNNFY
ncbi:hypothetical protein HYPBUDRAFT_103347 [Hyphopichia burtonii NRRL Y-1933]|uniref:Telomere length regulation protein conserved domain-containing protein n=1 Tax=Hyphopichia burtonii NRRL Y-1933 TaxID=984485 RepID=A0A1E4RRX0_9ASCO|nr:hypothetical protein HYPBUDRAFT_103347 [Hyphopichia burtonii NRRL Y-1933]ODV69976.1 hypothetical protein HYPBUDRAFT_103347 [Hyphopichia burtonii NRRL Y-1933]